jgi:hypothetical protein
MTATLVHSIILYYYTDASLCSEFHCKYSSNDENGLCEDFIYGTQLEIFTISQQAGVIRLCLQSFPYATQCGEIDVHWKLIKVNLQNVLEFHFVVGSQDATTTLAVYDLLL